MSFAIRPARTSDAEAISALILDLANYFIADPESPAVAPFLETLTPQATEERIVSEEYECFVAEDDGEISGALVMRNETHLYHLFVRAECQGQGIAGALWDHVLARSDASSFTVNSSINARPVYERFGFEATDEAQHQNGLDFVPMKYNR